MGGLLVSLETALGPAQAALLALALRRRFRNSSILAGDERQAHQQMPMDRIPLDLDRKLSLRYIMVWLANMGSGICAGF
jgi:hypothetical protein